VHAHIVLDWIGYVDTQTRTCFSVNAAYVSVLKHKHSVGVNLMEVRNHVTCAGVTPPAPSTVTATHPLLVRHDEPRTVTNPVIGTILHRSGRERDTYRYNPNTQTLHVQRERMRRPNPSAVLQR